MLSSSTLFAEESAPEIEVETPQEQSQIIDRSKSRQSQDDNTAPLSNEKHPQAKPATAAPLTPGDSAQVGADLFEGMANIDWGMAIFICLFSMLSATLFLWMRFAKYQFLGVIVNPYSITLILLVGFTCLGLFMLGSSTYLSAEGNITEQSYSSYLVALGSAVVSNFFPAIGRLLNLRKKASTSQDSEYVKYSLNYFYTEILLHIQSRMRAELIQYARAFDWKLIKRLLSRMVTDCLSTEIISDEKAQKLKERISQYHSLEDEYDDIEAKYDAISTILKDVHFKKVRAVFHEVNG